MTPDSRHIWGILVNHAGAIDTDSNWVSFRQWLDGALAKGGDEYRFMGTLGFGGKFWIDRDGRMYVTCYPEDRTRERERVIAETNAELAALQEGASA